MSMKPNAGADRMGTMPVGKLLATMAIPMMISMMFQSVTRASASAKRISEVLESLPAIEDNESTPETKN